MRWDVENTWEEEKRITNEKDGTLASTGIGNDYYSKACSNDKTKVWDSGGTILNWKYG